MARAGTWDTLRTTPARRGFTLVELTIVTFIIGILVGIAIPSYLISRDNSNKAVCQEDRRTADRWLQVYVQRESKTPEDIQELVDLAYISPIHCPAGGTYELRLSEGSLGETATYHPIPYLWCSIHGSDHETDQDGTVVAEEVKIIENPDVGEETPGPLSPTKRAPLRLDNFDLLPFAPPGPPPKK